MTPSLADIVLLSAAEGTAKVPAILGVDETSVEPGFAAALQVFLGGQPEPAAVARVIITFGETLSTEMPPIVDTKSDIQLALSASLPEPALDGMSIAGQELRPVSQQFDQPENAPVPDVPAKRPLSVFVGTISEPAANPPIADAAAAPQSKPAPIIQEAPGTARPITILHPDVASDTESTKKKNESRPTQDVAPVTLNSDTNAAQSNATGSRVELLAPVNGEDEKTLVAAVRTPDISLAKPSQSVSNAEPMRRDSAPETPAVSSETPGSQDVPFSSSIADSPNGGSAQDSLREAVTPFTRESITVSVVTRHQKPSPVDTIASAPVPVKSRAHAAVADKAAELKPDSESFARAFFQSKTVVSEPATIPARAQSVVFANAKVESKPVSPATPVSMDSAELTDVADLVRSKGQPVSQNTHAPEKKPAVRSTGTPVDRTAAPVPTDAAPAKVEQSATTIEPEATRLDGTSPRLTVDQATRPHAAQTLRYEIERPREFQVPGQIRVRIDPPELGQVRVDITSSRDGIIGTLRFESPQAREMVGRDLANLHRTLTDAGIRVERLDIVGATSGDSRTSFHQSTSDQQHGFHSFSRGSSQGQSQGGRYTQQHGYAPQNHTPTRTWSADAHETVWQPPAGMMMQVNLVA